MKLTFAYKLERPSAGLIPAPDQNFLRSSDTKKPDQKIGFSIGTRCRLTLGELRTLTRFTQTNLLTLNLTCITSNITRFAH